MARPPASPTVTPWCPRSSHKWHLIACEASALLSSAVIIGEWMAQEMVSLSPSPVWARHPGSLPFLNPLNIVTPLLVARFRFLDYLGILPLHIRPLSLLLTGFCTSLHSLEPGLALAELQLACPCAHSEKHYDVTWLWIKNRRCLLPTCILDRFYLMFHVRIL